MQLRRLPSSSSVSGGELPSSVNRTLSETGRGMEPALRQDMESRFGYDFSRVRLHTGASAQQSTRDVSAQAYTVGEHIAFGANRYAPGSASGRNLLAHELAHVVQQGRGGKRLQRRTLKEEAAAGCGICYGMAALAGIQAHKEIQVPWVLDSLLGLAGADKQAEVPLSCKGKKRRPDLVLRRSSNLWIIGSIKPARRSYYNDGANVFKMYSACIKAAYPGASVLPLRVPMPAVGMPFPNPGATGCRSQKFLFNEPDEFGVYGYYCEPGRRELLRDPGCTCKKKKKKDKKKKKNKSKNKSKQKKTPKKGASKTKGPTSAKPKAKIKPKAKPKIKPKKPKAPKGTAKPKAPKTPKAPKGTPKPKSAGGAGNVGFGLSLFSIGGGAGNAGVGISIASSSTGFGTAGAGVSILSDTVGAGAVGVGGTVASDGMGVGVAGAGGSVDSSSMAAGAAGAGTTESSEGMAAGAAGAGSVEDSELDGAGVAGHGEVKGSQVSGRSGTGSGKLDNVQGKGSGSADKPVDAKDVSGDTDDASKANTEGQQEVGDAAGEGGDGDEAHAGANAAGGDGKGKGAGKGDGDGQAGKPSAQDGGTGPGTGTASQGTSDAGAATPGADADAGTAAGTPGTDATPGTPGAGGSADASTPKGDLQAQIEAALAKAAPDSTPEDRAKAAAEAVKLNEMLKGASAAQRNLLAKLAEQNGGQYKVPTSDWAKTLLDATEGITDADLQYLMTLNWVPGHLSPAELRKRVLAVLKKRASQGAPGTKPAANAGEAKPAGEGKGPGSGAGAGKGTGSGTEAPGAEAPVGKQGENKDGVLVDADAIGQTKGSGGYTVARKFTGERKDTYEKNYSFLVDDKAINARTKIGDAPVMTLHWIAEDGKSYYFRQQYRIKGGPFEETDKKPGSKTMLRFTLESANSDLIDISPEGMEPFLLSPNRLATYRVYKP